MDAAAGEMLDGVGAEESDEIRSLRPNRDRWRVILAGSAREPATRRDAWAAAAALAGVAGSAGLAVLAGARPDLGGFGPAALLCGLAAACAPAAFCLRLAAAPPESRAPEGSIERQRADVEPRERVLAEQLAATRREPADAPSRPAAASAPKMRRHARITPRQTRTFIATEDGRRLNAVIIDVSQSGVAIAGNLPGLWIGSMVKVGSRRAKAVRVLPRGMAFEFSTPIAAEALTVDLVL